MHHIGSAIVGLFAAGALIGAAAATAVIFGLLWLWALVMPGFRPLVG